MFDTFSGSFPVNAFLLPFCHVSLSTSPKLFCMGSGNRYDIKCNFHMLHVVLHEPDLQYGVTDRHHSTVNSVGLVHEWGLFMLAQSLIQ